MVMEYLPRGAIFDVLQNPEERISWKMKWKFALEMAEGLNYIHTRQPPIVHRDLKTANFLLSEGWRVKLCDFGLAIPLFPPPPAENCGTVRWTAPEINDSQGLFLYFVCMLVFDAVCWFFHDCVPPISFSFSFSFFFNFFSSFSFSF